MSRPLSTFLSEGRNFRGQVGFTGSQGVGFTGSRGIQGFTGSAGPSSLDSMTDVTLSSPSDGQVLAYDSATSQWVNETPSGGGGGVTTGKAIAMAIVFG